MSGALCEGGALLSHAFLRPTAPGAGWKAAERTALS